MPDAAETMTDDRRREIFAALVATQDEGVPVAKSRTQVADRFGITREAVVAIEREGMDKEWPPL
jgi:crotonobetainyl-CoA:carnitine CoA-transferase CaiB-like acyl-CoA transferase